VNPARRDDDRAAEPWCSAARAAERIRFTELDGAEGADISRAEPVWRVDFASGAPFNMGGRIYDPTLGRFLQPDPFVQGVDGQGLNRYSYARNNPLSLTDPSGYLVADTLVNGFTAGFWEQIQAADAVSAGRAVRSHDLMLGGAEFGVRVANTARALAGQAARQAAREQWLLAAAARGAPIFSFGGVDVSFDPDSIPQGLEAEDAVVPEGWVCGGYCGPFPNDRGLLDDIREERGRLFPEASWWAFAVPVGIVAGVGLAVLAPEVAISVGPAPTVALAQRLQAFSRQTVGVLATSEGPTLVAAQPGLSPGQVAQAMRLGLTVVENMVEHAEVNLIMEAARLRLTPTWGAVSNLVCSRGGCQDYIRAVGGWVSGRLFGFGEPPWR